MADLLSNASKKPVNKWLLGFMLLTVILTAWTAFNDHANKADDTALSDGNMVNKSTKKGLLQKSSTTQDQIKSLQVASNEQKITEGNSTLIPWQHLTRKQPLVKPYNVFKVHSWVVAPPIVKQKPPPTPIPVAPAAPFTYMGKLDDPIKGAQIFLTADNGRLYSVFKGEKINQQWRLDNEDANNIGLTFLPLNLPQILSKAAKPALPLTTAEPVITDVNS
jgi:hypothetical protein